MGIEGLKEQEEKLIKGYEDLIYSKAVEWDGRNTHVMMLTPVIMNPDRGIREKVWRLTAEQLLTSRYEFSTSWSQLVSVRHQIARESGLQNFCEYQWQKIWKRSDYSIQDAIALVAAIKKLAVPALQRIHERWRSQLGIDSLRPWDICTSPTWLPWRSVGPTMRTVQPPFNDTEDLQKKVGDLFFGIDLRMCTYFELMRLKGCLDLEPRSDNVICRIDIDSTRKFCVRMNSTGMHADMTALLHEVSHLIHLFLVEQESQGISIGGEFMETVAFAMQLLSEKQLGAIYPPNVLATVQIQHFEWMLEAWVNVAMFLEFECWAYLNPIQSANPVKCDKKWSELLDCFTPGLDWTGLDNAKSAGWQWAFDGLCVVSLYVASHVLGTLGAVQIWQSSLHDYSGTVERLKQAMKINSNNLHKLFDVAGIQLSFDEATVRDAVGAVEGKIEELVEAG